MLSEQLAYFHAENRLLCNYIRWYERRILDADDEDATSLVSIGIPSTKEFPFVVPSQKQNVMVVARRTLKSAHSPILSLGKKRDIAEAIYKVLVGYSQKYGTGVTHYANECIVTSA